MNAGKKAKQIALCGVISALSLVLMLLAGVMPGPSYAVAALAGVIFMLIFSEFGFKTAFSVFACVSLLSFILVVDKSIPLLFVCFLGWYPIAKNGLDKIKPKFLGYFIKLLIFAATIALFYFICTKLLGIPLDPNEGFVKVGSKLLITFVAIAFVIYDIALARVYYAYRITIQERLHKIIFS